MTTGLNTLMGRVEESVLATFENPNHADAVTFIINTGQGFIEEYESSHNQSLFDTALDVSIRDCLYMLRERFSSNGEARLYHFNKDLLTAINKSYISTLPYEPYTVIMALFFEAAELVQRIDRFDTEDQHDLYTMDKWFMIACEYAALAEYIREERDNICQMPPYTGNIAPVDFEMLLDKSR